MSFARTNADAVHLPPGQVTEGARHREARIVAALRQRPGLLEDILRRTEGSQSQTLADLTMLVDAGTLVQHVVYALPGQRVEVR